MNEEALTSMSGQQTVALSLSLGPSALNSRLLFGKPEPLQGPDLNPLEASSNWAAADCTEQPECLPPREHKVNSWTTLRPKKPNTSASHTGYSLPQ